MKLLKLTLLSVLMLTVVPMDMVATRQKLNFNSAWRLQVGDFPDAVRANFDDSRWRQVTLPYAFNGDEAFRKDIVDLTDTIVWYRKKFTVLAEASAPSARS